MASMPQEIRVTIGFEESYQESLDFLEAMFRECREKALQEGKNGLAAFVGLRLEVLEFQRAYVKERVEFLGEPTEDTHKLLAAEPPPLEGGTRGELSNAEEDGQ